MNQAMDGLRKSGGQAFIPSGLLARAAYFRIIEQHDGARRDLDQAMRIATRSAMRLHECDAHLELARLALAQEHCEIARTHLARAEALVVAIGYHRRDGEIEALLTALA